MKPPIPLLIFSDAVSAPTGLARITRDIASRVHANLSDVFRVATIGYGGAGSSKFGWTQYSWTHNGKWIIRDLPEIWEDFAGNQRGIFMSVYDPHRMLWLARPETCTEPLVQKFLEKAPFKKWGYFPIDATGPNDRLAGMLKACLMGYDRILCYSEWARKIVANTLRQDQSLTPDYEATKRDLDQLPHGIDTSIFFPRPRARQRQMFGQMAVGQPGISIADDELLVGIVATNQARKDYGLGIATCAELAKTRKVRVWIHTDALERNWVIPWLCADFGLDGGNLISLDQFSDDTMAKLYSACDVTLGIGLGEGFGYPIFESLACGCPCIHGNYGGAPEHMSENMLVTTGTFRHEGVYGCVRPVFSPRDWADKIEALEPRLRYCLPPRLDWNNLWPRWEAWFRKGIFACGDMQKVRGSWYGTQYHQEGSNE